MLTIKWWLLGGGYWVVARATLSAEYWEEHGRKNVAIIKPIAVKPIAVKPTAVKPTAVKPTLGSIEHPQHIKRDALAPLRCRQFFCLFSIDELLHLRIVHVVGVDDGKTCADKRRDRLPC